MGAGSSKGRGNATFAWGFGLMTVALLFTSCVSSNQNSDSEKSSSTDLALTGSSAKSVTSFSLLARLEQFLVGNPSSSTDQSDPNSGRVCTVDNFQQAPAPTYNKADILFVQETSGFSCRQHNLDQKWKRISDNIQLLIQQIPAGIDIRVGVILAHVGQYSGQLYSAKGQSKVLSSQNMTPTQIGKSLRKTFEAAAPLTDRALGGAAFYSLNAAITNRLKDNQKAGFFRPDATLAIVFMSHKQELGYPFPDPPPSGIPPLCDGYWENRFKKEYYDSQNLNTDKMISRLKKLKGEVPITTHALVNLNRDDLFKHNSPNAQCLYDTLGYGYFDIVQKTNGVLWSIESDHLQGMIEIGRSVSDSLDLAHDFKLSKPAEHVDPQTIHAFVDELPKTHSYDSSSDVVHLEDAGTFSSKIRIEHCDYYRYNWQITDLAGVPTFNAVTLSWKTPGQDTKAIVKVGLSSNDLSLRTINVSDFSANHTLLVDSLQPKTTYYFQVVAHDKFTGMRTSDVIAVTTLEEPILWKIEDFGGVTTSDIATLSWKTSGEATRAVLYVGLSADDLSLKQVLVDEFNVAHSSVVDGLSSNTVYFFKVIAEDQKGRRVESEIISLRTKELPPPEWHVVGLDATTTIDSATVFWETQNVPAKAILKVGLSADDLTFKSIDIGEFKSSQMVAVPGLNPDTLYFFQVFAEDQIGRQRASSILPKRTKPDPILWSVNNLGGTTTYNTATINWDTGSEPTRALLKVGLSADDLSLKSIPLNDLAVSHSQLVDGLSESTTYYFQVVATDSKNRSLTSPVISLQTPVEPILWGIQNFTGSADFITASLQWNTGSEPTTAVLNVGLSANDLRFKVINISDLATAHSIQVDGLQQNTTYFFQITAFDARNRSKTSSVISLKTQQQTWTVVGLDGTTTPTSAQIIWQTPNTLTHAKLHVGLSANDLSLMTLEIAQLDSAHLVVVNGLTPSTRYFFQVEAFDQQGRKVISNIISKQTKAAVQGSSLVEVSSAGE